jgi:hypothetical protein
MIDVRAQIKKKDNAKSCFKNLQILCSIQNTSFMGGCNCSSCEPGLVGMHMCVHVMDRGRAHLHWRQGLGVQTATPMHQTMVVVNYKGGVAQGRGATAIDKRVSAYLCAFARACVCMCVCMYVRECICVRACMFDSGAQVCTW